MFCSLWSDVSSVVDGRHLFIVISVYWCYYFLLFTSGLGRGLLPAGRPVRRRRDDVQHRRDTIYIYIYIHMYIYIYIRITCIRSLPLSLSIYIYMYDRWLYILLDTLYIYVCMYVCMYVYIYVYIHIIHMYMYIYIYIYIARRDADALPQRRGAAGAARVLSILWHIIMLEYSMF